MKLLIDGNNLLGHLDRVANRESVLWLLAMLTKKYRADEVILALDHEAEYPECAFILLFPARPFESTADEAIIRFLKHTPRPGEWVLVSQDRELVERALLVGVGGIQKVTDFAGSIQKERFTEEKSWTDSDEKAEYLSDLGDEAQAITQSLLEKWVKDKKEQ